MARVGNGQGSPPDCGHHASTGAAQSSPDLHHRHCVVWIIWPPGTMWPNMRSTIQCPASSSQEHLLHSSRCDDRQGSIAANSCLGTLLRFHYCRDAVFVWGECENKPCPACGKHFSGSEAVFDWPVLLGMAVDTVRLHRAHADTTESCPIKLGFPSVSTDSGEIGES